MFTADNEIIRSRYRSKQIIKTSQPETRPTFGLPNKSQSVPSIRAASTSSPSSAPNVNAFRFIEGFPIVFYYYYNYYHYYLGLRKPVQKRHDFFPSLNKKMRSERT